MRRWRRRLGADRLDDRRPCEIVGASPLRRSSGRRRGSRRCRDDQRRGWRLAEEHVAVLGGASAAAASNGRRSAARVTRPPVRPALWLAAHGVVVRLETLERESGGGKARDHRRVRHDRLDVLPAVVELGLGRRHVQVDEIARIPRERSPEAAVSRAHHVLHHVVEHHEVKRGAAQIHLGDVGVDDRRIPAAQVPARCEGPARHKLDTNGRAGTAPPVELRQHQPQHVAGGAAKLEDRLLPAAERVAAEEGENPRLPWIGLARAAHLVDLGQEAHRVARVLNHLVAQRLAFLGGQRLAGEQGRRRRVLRAHFQISVTSQAPTTVATRGGPMDPAALRGLLGSDEASDCWKF